ncbi:MAG TPA: uracil-DNA glycosylase [Verrucomicrobiae bacterium]
MDAYAELLDATINHLKDLKRQGTRYVPVSADLVKSLSSGPSRTPSQPARIEQARTPSPAPLVQRPPATPPKFVAPADAPASAPPTKTAAPKSPNFVEPVVFSDNASKLEAFQQLRERALVCQKCANLVASRKNVVFGVGSIDAELMFIGEAPGADEDEQGEPFVGKAGQLLTKVIQAIGLAREQVYIANILKCRPDTPGQAYGNRPPTPDEMERCLPYLHAQIDLIKPKVIVALGATAVDGLFGKVPGVGITKLRGKWREYRGTPVMPTYHPSYLLRPNPNNIKRETWEDMMQVMTRLKIPITEKQRGYFLKAPGQE